jgi:ATP-dependent helicase HrpA
LLPVYRRARTALDDDRLRADARTDIARQLEALIHPRLLSSTPVPWRRRLPRYVRAVEVRLDKLRRRHPKDADHQARIERAEQRFVQWRATLPAEWPLPAAMVRYRWMVEEYRVSLFAQALGTALPVSDRRLDDAWQAALEEASAT